MQNINIDDGKICLTVNNDESRVIEFKPGDIQFIDRFYALITEYEQKNEEYIRRGKELAENKELDATGIPTNFADCLALLREICEYTKDKVDEVFGPGTSQAAFGDNNTIGMFSQFFDGIVPYIHEARTKAIASKYLPDAQSKRVMK